MPTAYINGADLQFPARCIGCDDAADITYDLHAWRGWDLIFIALWETIDISVPVCRRCRKRRRVAGIATYTSAVLFILVGGYFTMALVLIEWKLAAASSHNKDTSQPGLGTILSEPQELPRVPRGTVRLLFSLIQVMYLSFYVLSLARLSRVEEILAESTNPTRPILIALIL